ncbi:hypothetical protein M0R19_03575 [Candidatus Pacearchaeota archaeon]|nr:hypothetical protein [Candidatus Pacearchaeota archaeon]
MKKNFDSYLCKKLYDDSFNKIKKLSFDLFTAKRESDRLLFLLKKNDVTKDKNFDSYLCNKLFNDSLDCIRKIKSFSDRELTNCNLLSTLLKKNYNLN